MIEIIPFQECHKTDFKDISEAWINEFMSLLPSDAALLNHPQETIIDQGGFIFMAQSEDKIVGTCALLKKSEERYELVKLGVNKAYRGQGIGKMLALAVIEKARSLGLKKLYLESSQVLQPAIALYRKLGFEDHNSKNRTAQCDVQMSLNL